MIDDGGRVVEELDEIDGVGAAAEEVEPVDAGHQHGREVQFAHPFVLVFGETNQYLRRDPVKNKL